MIKMAPSFLIRVAEDLRNGKAAFGWKTVWALLHHIDALNADIDQLQNHVVELCRKIQAHSAEEHIIDEYMAFVKSGNIAAAEAVEMVLTRQGKTDLLKRMGVSPRPFPNLN
ncbi:hypothetical protein ACFFSY_29310 [Paenibacillus aurantiacus]|uniref:Uncharacterized protein n=1 Tax=Paenibacillus aurantiacus TaxID=1936118 RepID=A0ABV5KXV9_9BACL